MWPSLSWDTPDTYLSLSGIGHMRGSVNSCCFKVTPEREALGALGPEKGEWPG